MKKQHSQSIIHQNLLSCREAIRLALERIKQEQVGTCWADAGEVLTPEWAQCGDADWAGGTLMRCGYRIKINATPDEVWDPIGRIGGRNSYYFAQPLWRLRGWLDRITGGPGLGRGRSDSSGLSVGDAVDFWRVLEVAPPHRLMLRAEMKMPGDALLEFEITSLGSNRSELKMISRFLPKGLTGIVYWYVLYPFHQWVFSGMLKSIAKLTGKRSSYPPERFTPKLHNSCALSSKISEKPNQKKYLNETKNLKFLERRNRTYKILIVQTEPIR